ncbi:MAG: hypothetical protein QM627_06950 [Luteolibacter sp.]
MPYRWMLRLPHPREHPPEPSLNALFAGSRSSKIHFKENHWRNLIEFINNSWKNQRLKWLATTLYRTGRGINHSLMRGIQPDATASEKPSFTIPILQYVDYLTHPFTHGVNCLIFQDPGSLRDTIARLLTMDAGEILMLRRNARAYYDAHLAPGRFIKKLASSASRKQVLLLNAYRVPR